MAKSSGSRSENLFDFDQTFRQQGIQYLCGVDEAGRGPLAGPVVAAAVILNPQQKIEDIDDSKKLTAEKRQKLAVQIKEKALAFGIGLATVEEIQQKNILKATFLAMQRAVEKLKITPDYLLIDGRDFPQLFDKNRQQPLVGQAVIGGDHLSQSIAAASILAKVYRDEMMMDYAQRYPQYGFEKHKGYATREHQQNILKFGPCPIHRHRFLRKLLNRQANLFEAEM
ncbi:MAG: ribonuclease HII [Caldisericaceae bacterium]|nr:ribonuclease HII [Caldisericaceae bacterium]